MWHFIVVWTVIPNSVVARHQFFLSCPYLSCLRRVGVEWQLVITCSDMMADHWRASCFSKPPLSCFTYVAEWKLSVIPQARCRSCPVTSFHLLCFNGYGHLMGWTLEPYEMINFTKSGGGFGYYRMAPIHTARCLAIMQALNPLQH